MQSSQMPNHPRFTHFISIPFNIAPMKTRFQVFMDEVLEKSAYIDQQISEGGDVHGAQSLTNIDKYLFQDPAKLHLTFGIMKLTNENEMQQATELLKNLREDIYQDILNEPLIVDVKGIDVMDSNPRECKVLYATIKNSDSNSSNDHLSRLQRMADHVVKRFQDAGLMKVESGRDHVKLHITLMNTAFRERNHKKRAENDLDWRSAPKRPPRQRFPRKSRDSFNALPILAEFNDFAFLSDYKISEVHISCREEVAEVRDEDGFYKPLSYLNLPTVADRNRNS